jgi:hypothetical protein
MTITHTELPTIEHFAPVDLASLNDLAALQTRIDRKYVLNPSELAELLLALPNSIRVLEIDGRRSFSYRSTYFDTPDHQAYLAAARKRRQRWKVRIRSYENTTGAMLEVKTKDGRGNTVKTRRPHDPASGHTLDQDGRRFIAATLGATCPTGRLVPTLAIGYRRTTLVDLADATRLTIDRDLTCDEWAHRRATIGERLIVETKSSGTPSAADRWLWSHRLRPVKISKYCTGLAALHPDLPSNKWTRSLRNHWELVTK